MDFKMKPRTNEVSRRSRGLQEEGPNWVLIAGSALLSTLAIRLGYKVKQVLDTKKPENSNNNLKGNGKSTDENKSSSFHFQPSAYCFPDHVDGCYNSYSGSRNVVEIKQQANGHMVPEHEMVLPLVTRPAPEFSKENGVLWASSPDHLELPQKPFHQSNSSDSLCVSESGSDIFSKREVIQKLRQQLRRRDDTILEMQDQITELHNSLNSQLSCSSHLQSLLDAANRDLFDSESEIQRLRKAIADHCVEHTDSRYKPPAVPIWPTEGRNGHANEYLEVENSSMYPKTGKGEREKIEMLKREVTELKEVIEGKEYLLSSYKDQKAELSVKIKELQQRLDSQLPNIL
ncbi:intracellular transporter [Olea europaea subsp. europaea]|uniref:Intracellular transporter n=1 Tax=Olea europaea subsp. europaea TaxID=158383 RepID=A0A8S0UY19_OLEEU|nr:intracellular transporter [Olea europaea subsp. europaea]